MNSKIKYQIEFHPPSPNFLISKFYHLNSNIQILQSNI